MIKESCVPFYEHIRVLEESKKMSYKQGYQRGYENGHKDTENGLYYGKTRFIYDKCRKEEINIPIKKGKK